MTHLISYWHFTIFLFFSKCMSEKNDTNILYIPGIYFVSFEIFKPYIAIFNTQLLYLIIQYSESLTTKLKILISYNPVELNERLLFSTVLGSAEMEVITVTLYYARKYITLYHTR